jgi:hypothetical protein
MLKHLMIIILLLMPYLLSAQTDTLVIKLKSGQVDKIAVTDITKVTFEDITGVNDDGLQNPNLITSGNYPNPFSDQTQIEFEITTSGNLEITIYDNQWNLQRRLECKNCSAGRNRLAWDGTDENGKQLPSGVYYYEVRFGNEVSSKKMINIK